MRQDVRIDEEGIKFKFRTCGILILDDKVLLQKINKQKFYCLPGGHVELLEDTKKTVLREMEEETKHKYTIKSLMTINENFFIIEENKYHEIGFYYLVEPFNNEKIKTENFKVVENDKGKIVDLTYEWIDLDKLNEVDFRPAFLKEKLSNRNYEFEHIITKEIIS